ncbi:methionyl-tRNA synthetase [Tieghemiomyces parasiticus]|uniref:Probable methionine--tRNA ligase, mitochondrial n=1 Tax=Tieghemiomyces parasiticus TaxID=78921 RepID=A0A9W8DQL5_9FUNG|nr:methionyl-tRNA synthetase [Tieghemiomyces parasiticus]
MPLAVTARRSAWARPSLLQRRLWRPVTVGLHTCLQPRYRSKATTATPTLPTTVVTTPIYYVNAAPHVGHLYSSVLADTLARYHRLQGRPVFLSTGTDEHGLKIQQAAARAGHTSPQTYCDQVAERFCQLGAAAHIAHDDFIRTTEGRHRLTVQRFWRALLARGHIYKGSYAGWYSVSDEAFYTPDQVMEVPETKQMVAKESGSAVEWTEEENYKFRLSAFVPQLLDIYTQSTGRIIPDSRARQVIQALQEYQQNTDDPTACDLSVSRPRSRLQWGIPVPDDPNHTIYVWLDALVNYLTVASASPVGSAPPVVTSADLARPFRLASDYSRFPPTLQIVGKDILKFHAIFWPAFLLALDLPLPGRIVAHAHWTMGNHKMSKSRGNVADPFAVMDRYGVDPVRFFLMHHGGLAHDADFSEDRILVDYRSLLVDQLGNLVARCAAKAFSPNFNAFSSLAASLQAPESVEAQRFTDLDREIIGALRDLPETVKVAYEQPDVRSAITHIFDHVAHINKYVTLTEPWNLRKRTDDAAAERQLRLVLFLALESARVAAIMLQPVMPTKAGQVLDALGVPAHQRTWADTAFGAGWPSAGGVDYTALASTADKVVFPRKI